LRAAIRRKDNHCALDDQLAPTRVLVVGQPLLREIVRGALAADPRVEIAAELDAASNLSEVVQRTGADIVVAEFVGDQTGESSLAGMRLMHAQRIRVISVSPDGGESFLSMPLGEVSPRRLLEVIAVATRAPFAQGGT